MRNKSRDIRTTGKSLIIKYFRDGFNETDREAYGNDVRLRYETIEDESGPNWNPVRHRRLEWDCPCPMTLPKSYSNLRGFPIEFEYTGGFQVGLPEPKPDIDWTDAMQQLLEDARGNMDENVNMIVNVAEIAQIKTLVPQLIKGLKNMRWLVSRKTLREIANGHLLYSFGVKPFLTDAIALWNVTSQIRARREELAKRSNRTVRLSKRVVNTITTTTRVGPFSSGQDFTYGGSSENWSKVVGVVSADCTAFYNLDDPSLRFKHVAQALGITTPFSSIWALTPCSFVADWVVPIGKAIRYCERKGLDLVNESAVTKSYQLTNFGTSKKFEGVSVPKLSIETSTVPGWVGRSLKTATLRWSYFERNPGEIPSYNYYGATSDWSVSKTALGISMILQRALGGKKMKGPSRLPSGLEFIHTKPVAFPKR